MLCQPWRREFELESTLELSSPFKGKILWFFARMATPLRPKTPMKRRFVFKRARERRFVQAKPVSRTNSKTVTFAPQSKSSCAEPIVQ